MSKTKDGSILVLMRVLVAASMLLSVPLTLRTQSTLEQSNSTDHPPQVSVPSEFKKGADETHKAGHIEEEIEYRQQFSHAEWAAFALDPHFLNEYERYNLVFFNDLPLGLLLEGSQILRSRNSTPTQSS